MKNKIIPLDKKIYNNKFTNDEEWFGIDVEDTKNSLQNLQKELKEELEKYGYPSALFLINKLFLKHIGKGLIKIK